MVSDIKIIPAYAYPQAVKALFTEYTDMLIAGDSSFQEYLAIQNYDEEIKHLEDKYGMPFGRLYLAYCDGKLAGCIGLRKIDESRCEMKRLYVRPQFMLLDTLPFLKSAILLYRELGFYEIPAYNDSPMENAIYMRRDL